MDDKVDKLRSVQIKLMEILDFLSNYLPLVNCHSNDFILNNHWNKFLTEPIRKELDSLSMCELVSLLNQTTTIEDKRPAEKLTKEFDPSLWKFECDYLEKASNSTDRRGDIYSSEMQTIPPNWVHENLQSLLQDAQRCSIQNSDILSIVEDLDNDMRTLHQDPVFISTFMNQKKTHEVEVMGELCYKLSHKHDIDVVVDLGSGKGYLSTHLAFQHKLSVIGVDAQTINTKGASKRADILSRQWEGLTRNEILRAQKAIPGKLGKKKKKELKKEECAGGSGQKGNNEKSSDVNSDILDDIFNDFSKFFEVQKKSENEKSNSENDERLDLNLSSQIQETSCNPTQKTLSGQVESRKSVGVKVKEESKLAGSDSAPMKNPVKKNTKSSALKANHFPITTYINIDSDLSVIVREALTLKSSQPEPESTSGENSGDMSTEHRVTAGLPTVSGSTEISAIKEKSRLMLTGLHTCGALGSNILRLFVNSANVKVLCNVACCYHLMSEKFVANPFEDKEDASEETGFPLSEFLQRNKVGIGRQARNLASQSVNRRAQDTEVLAKQFPRMLLQVILRDQLGYVRSDWKGLRKLDQKSQGMFDYVTRAFRKLGLPTDGISEELVESYCQKYEDQKKKFAAFFQLKTVLAPCIEAVVVLDRLCFLLEQESVQDAKLIQLFDPVTSPRCYGIVSVKK